MSLRRRHALALAAAPLMQACTTTPAATSAAPGAAAAPARLQGPAVELPRTLWQDLADSATGDVWRVMVQAPLTDAAPPPGGHPVLYVLDGHRSFVLAAQMARVTLDRPQDVRGDIPIVVGLDLPSTTLDTRERLRRYAPAPRGQADALLHFFARQLQPMLAAQWPINPARQTLFGHSVPGLFVVHALLTRGDLFSGYAAASPSLWLQGDADYWQQHTAGLLQAPAAPLRARLQLSLGALETGQRAPSAERASKLAQRRPLDSLRALNEQLRALASAAPWPQFSSTLAVYPDLDHGRTMPSALLDAFSLARQPAP